MVSILNHINHNITEVVVIENCTVTVLNTTEKEVPDNEDILVYVGNNVTLRCSCENNTILWTNLSGFVDYVNESILTLVSVLKNDSGIYSCEENSTSNGINITIYCKY